MPSIKALCDHLHLSVAVAESASVGHLAALLGTESGASSFFRGGVVTYSLQSKVTLLGVDEAHASTCDCVSEQVAQEMAAGVRRLFDTDIGVAITGYAEPSPGHGVDSSFCWIGFAVEDRVWAERVEAYDVDLLIDANERRVATQVHFAEMAVEGLQQILLVATSAASAKASNRERARAGCLQTLRNQADRVWYFEGRRKDLAPSPDDAVVVLVNADTTIGELLAGMLMPGTSWQPFRDRGEIPFARGVAERRGIRHYLEARDPQAAAEMSDLTGQPTVVVIDYGIATAFPVSILDGDLL